MTENGHRPGNGLQPVGYLTAHDLAAMWDERVQQMEQHRQRCPTDVRGIEQRQRLALQALQAYRVLCDLEEQLGYQLALPVLGPRLPRAVTAINAIPELVD